MNSLLRLDGIGKSYIPGLPVLKAVDVNFNGGEVHSLVGENGAGKSTLAGILAGLVSPSEGRMQLDGSPYTPKTRRQAERSGVSIVTQEFNLLSTLTVAESLTVDQMPAHFGVIDRKRQRLLAEEALRRVGAKLEVDRRIEALGIAQRQLVEVAKGLGEHSRLVILDEPTASLSDSESEALFERIEALKAQGVSILYVSHKLEEVLRLSDRITALRDGEIVGSWQRGEIDKGGIVKAMVGRELLVPTASSNVETGGICLEVKNVRAVSFTLRSGEVVGLAGLVGAGRTELLRAIFGADRARGGTVEVGGKMLARRTPVGAVRAGIGLLTEDRKDQGLFLPLSVRNNISFANLRSLARFGVVNLSREVSLAKEMGGRLNIRGRGPDQPVRELSGGNQQKVVLAKWLAKGCDVLLFDEPTRGIDIGAKEEIYELVRDLARQGKGIVIASSELNELFALCDRILVLSNGRLAAEFPRPEFESGAIMKAALRFLEKTA